MYCVLNMGWTPSQYTSLPYKERIFVMACIDIKLQKEKEAQKKMQAKKPRKARRR